MWYNVRGGVGWGTATRAAPVADHEPQSVKYGGVEPAFACRTIYIVRQLSIIWLYC